MTRESETDETAFARVCADCEVEDETVELRRVETRYSELERPLCDGCAESRGIET